MTEEVLQKLPDVSEFPTNVKVKNTNQVLKEAIIAANPDFANINWGDFEFSGTTIYGNDIWNEETGQYIENSLQEFQLKLKNNPDRIKYYRNRTPYTFRYNPVDATSLCQAVFGPLMNKTFKYELKDQLPSLLQTVPYFTYRMDLSFKEIRMSDHEIIYFFTLGEHNGLETPSIYYNAGGGLENLSFNSDKIKENIEYWKQHVPYVRFLGEAVREEDMISTPAQQSQPNLTINPSNVYTVS